MRPRAAGKPRRKCRLHNHRLRQWQRKSLPQKNMPNLTSATNSFYLTDEAFGKANNRDLCVSEPVSKPSHLREAEDPHSESVTFPADQPLVMDAGALLAPLTIAYQTYGTLNADKSNAVLVCHALTGDQHVANIHPITGKNGWWSTMIGPGRPIDTNRYFVICSNVVGGCMGTTGPASINPANGRAYGLDLPVVTIRDMVRAQAMLVDYLGIDTLFCCIGGSMGGMQVLQWAAVYPERVFCAMPIATAPKHSSQNIAFHEVGRQAVMADPNWLGGRYHDDSIQPEKGLAVARMAAHITYLSDEALQRKFGRNYQDRAAPTFSFDADFQVESYLRYQGASFVDRFDANSYLYVTRACDYFDLAADYGGSLAAAFQGTKTRFCVVSFTSDWLYPTSASRAIVHALNASGASVSFVEIETDKGHDAFLLDEPEFMATSRGFLDAAARARGLPPTA
jgi:homoserine O-acetyltransferase